MEAIERARKYLATMEPSVSGSGSGHAMGFKAACAMVWGFDLSPGEAFELLKSDYNPRCVPPGVWTDAELWHKVRQAEIHGGSSGSARGYLRDSRREGGSSSGGSSRSREASAGAVEKPRARKRPDFDRRALERLQVAGFRPDHAWLAERSPVDPRGVEPGQFLDHLFSPGERVLIFTNFFGQGEFGHVAGSPGKSWRLGKRPGVDPEPAQLPAGDRCGAWFLPVPVDGKWHPTGSVDEGGRPKLSRRSGASVLEWRHLLLESDEAPDAEWLNLLAQLPLPISALYTSGGRSIHALLRIRAKSKGHFDAFRDRISPLLAKLGADPAALSGVRLTRLPGVLRHGTEKRLKNGRLEFKAYDEPRMQELLFLNPDPEVAPLQQLPRLRRVKGGAGG